MIRTIVFSLFMAFLAFFGLFMISGCGYDGSYRYPCQDPTNWDAAECTEPLCEADGTCTKYLLPEEALNE